MSNEGNIPGDIDVQDTKAQTLNDLVYSLETKTFQKFMSQLISNNIFHANVHIHDPLPQCNFDSIIEEIKRRLAGMEKPKLDDIKNWLRDPLKRITQLEEEIHRSLGKTHVEMDSIRLTEVIKKNTALIEEINSYKAKLGSLIRDIEESMEQQGKEKNIRHTTKVKVQQLDLFEPNDADG